MSDWSWLAVPLICLAVALGTYLQGLNDVSALQAKAAIAAAEKCGAQR